MGRKKRKVAVIDFETDPFEFGRVPEPFCCEFYSDQITKQFWGDNCGEELCDYLETLEEQYLIYAHNGGKFDFHFILNRLDNPARIIKTRIVEAKLGKHTMRDSFAILPVPLRDYEKMEFEYWKMERPHRGKYKKQILEYLHSDCVNLYNMVSAFVDRFGPQLTIGGTAIRELKKHHPFSTSGRRHDEMFRMYYYGGRVQVFKSGILPGPWKLYDVNSMYPASMKYKNHPINGRFHISREMPNTFEAPFFVTFRGKNTNALPSIAENGELVFNKKEGIFNACSHEIEIALDHKLIEINEIIECFVSSEYTTFDGFVDMYYAEKAKCKVQGDKIGELFAKLLLNSAYGRFGINPDNFADWIINKDFGNEQSLEDDGYSIACDLDAIELWSRPTEIKDRHFADVAVAASITSGARSILLEGLQNAIDPLYCDTDSIICKDFAGDIHKTKLGAWDLEKVSDNVAIGGKKMYAMYDNKALGEFSIKRTNLTLKCGKCKAAFTNPVKHREHEKACTTKLSSKGGSLDLQEIISIAKGDTVKFNNDAPTFSLKHEPKFVSRTFKQTLERAGSLD